MLLLTASDIGSVGTVGNIPKAHKKPAGLKDMMVISKKVYTHKYIPLA